MKKLLRALVVVWLWQTPAYAAEIGHYSGGLANIRDYFVPEPGFYAMLYNYYYRTDRLNDDDGDEVRSVNINPGPGPGVTLNLDVDVDVYALAPVIMWVSPLTILGARVAAYIAPSFSNSHVGVAVQSATGRGESTEFSQFSLADLFVQPLWLGWPLEHFDFAFGYGFYAPTGKYETEPLVLPGVGTIRVEDSENIGLGFWTNQFQAAGAWYPWVNKATAVTAVLTYEIHSDKDDFRMTPGQDLTFNWGISQMLPLTKDQKLLAEVGPAGYSTWQTTNDSGRDASDTTEDEVHAVGAQVGLTKIDWVSSINFHYFYEAAAENRFQGHVIGLSAGTKF